MLLHRDQPSSHCSLLAFWRSPGRCNLATSLKALTSSAVAQIPCFPSNLASALLIGIWPGASNGSLRLVKISRAVMEARGTWSVSHEVGGVPDGRKCGMEVINGGGCSMEGEAGR